MSMFYMFHVGTPKNVRDKKPHIMNFVLLKFIKFS